MRHNTLALVLIILLAGAALVIPYFLWRILHEVEVLSLVLFVVYVGTFLFSLGALFACLFPAANFRKLFILLIAFPALLGMWVVVDFVRSEGGRFVAIPIFVQLPLYIFLLRFVLKRESKTTILSGLEPPDDMLVTEALASPLAARGASRHKNIFTVHCKMEGCEVTGETVDVSALGVHMVSSEKIEGGKKVELTIKRPQTKSIYAEGEVRWARVEQTTDHKVQYHTGIKFTRISAVHKLRLLLLLD